MITVKIPFKRGTASQNDAYKGADGEITIDDTNKSLRVHDGVTNGGTRLLTQNDLDSFLEGGSNLDQRYQVVSPTVIYRAEAAPGSADTAQAWRIQKLVINYSTKVVTKTWANGLDTFVHKWSDRATYNYTL